MDLGIVDICPTPPDGTQADAFRNSVDLAQRAEALGFKRYWLAEHHGSAAVASHAPEILIEHVASATETIRVGSGAVLLNHYSPLKVAEQFRTLHALHPGRIDLGVGRAFAGPVADFALQRRRDVRPTDDYGHQVFELLSWITRTMPPDHGFATLDLAPDVPGSPEMLLLGSSQSSPQLAAQLGLPYVFAGFISPHGALGALSDYRQGFRPSQAVRLEKPNAILAVHVVCADTTEEAERLAMSVRHMYATLSSGKLESRLHTPEQATAYFGHVVRAEDDIWPRFVIGDPARVRSILARMIEQSQADEIIIQDLITDHLSRARSHALIAGLFQ
jgi:luciferase family oxidoreductase group 1|tara:strand:- start:3301 stop:4296 length:996 start_codon:yes stop_codon:yes gene_type:complete